MRQAPMPVTGTRAAETLDWLSWGDSDYVAARRLLLDDLLVQGAALANTALEKYLKAVFAISQQRIPRIHDPLRLYVEIKSAGGTLSLDESFLALLVKAYDLRYPDDLEPGYNIVLTQAAILNALDESVFELNGRFRFERSDSRPVHRLLDHLIETKDPRVLTKNTALKTLTKNELLGGQSSVFEMRMLPNGVRLEAHYSTEGIADPRFDREALVPKNNSSSC
jgi:HEPN domain-containing protein